LPVIRRTTRQKIFAGAEFIAEISDKAAERILSNKHFSVVRNIGKIRVYSFSKKSVKFLPVTAVVAGFYVCSQGHNGKRPMCLSPHREAKNGDF
jgi:hypothetical protein